MRIIVLQALMALAVVSPAGRSVGRSRLEPPVVTIANLRDHGVVHSGFVVGTATAGAGHSIALVEVSLDSGTTFQPAAGTTSWKFRLPTGAFTWKDNSAHSVEVRATDSNGTVTTTSPLSVRKGVNQDVDGDGFADVVVGAPAFDNSRGRVYLFYSAKNGSGIPSTNDADNLNDANVKVIGGETGAGPQQFGASTALGDVNADGFADLIVGAPASLNGAGHLYVIFAAEITSGNALVVVGNATGTSVQILGDAARHLGLGTSVAAGDVNGDGAADVVAGAPGTTSTPAGVAGRVYVFHAGNQGANHGLAASTVAGANSTIIADSAGTDFGRAVAVGDVNGDTFSDVIAGATLSTGTHGQVYIFHAAWDGTGVPNTFVDASGAPATSTTAANTHIIGEATSRLGASLAVGDLNGDGFVDIVAGGPTFGGSDNPNRGRVYVFYSEGAAGVPTNPTLDENDTTPGQHIIGGEFGAGAQLFGSSLAVGDIDGDGTEDLIIGAPAAWDGAGVAYVFPSTPGSGLTQGNAINARSTGVQINGDDDVTLAFGTSVAVGDVNGDGVMDLIGGAAGDATFAGRVFVFHAAAGQGITGDINGMRSILGATSTLIGAAGSLFGSSIAR